MLPTHVRTTLIASPELVRCTTICDLKVVRFCSQTSSPIPAVGKTLLVPRSRASTTCREGCVAHVDKRLYILTSWQAQHSVPSTDDGLLLITLMQSVNHYASQVLVLFRTQQRLWPSTPRSLHISRRKLPRDHESPSGFARCVVQYRPASALRKPSRSQNLTQSWRRHVHVPRRERLRH